MRNMKRILITLLLLASPAVLRAQTSYGRIQTDRISNKQTIIITGATPDVSNGNVFKTNNGAPTTITNFLNGVDSQVITVNCGEANTTIQNNVNIVTSVAADIVCTLNKAQDFTYDAAQTKWVQKSGGAVSGGGSPSGNNGDLQSKNGSLFGAASINDNSTLPGVVSVGRPTAFAGPDPYVDIRNYGGYLTASSATATTTNGSATVSLSAASNFRNGEYATIWNAGAACSLSTPGTPTVTPSTNPGGVFNTIPGPTGSNTNGYKVIAVSATGCYTAASPEGTTNTAATLGLSGAVITAVTASGSIATATTSGPHGFVAGEMIYVQNNNFFFGIFEGFTQISSVPDSTHFSYAIPGVTSMGTPTTSTISVAPTCYVTNTVLTGNTATVTCANTFTNIPHLPVVITGTANGGGVFNGSWQTITRSGTQIQFHLDHADVTTAADSGTVTVANVWGFNTNRISWTAVPNAFKYVVYGRIAGNEVRLGQTMFNFFDDYGFVLANGQTFNGQTFPGWVPATPPVASGNNHLTTKINSGGGTTSLTLNTTAGVSGSFWMQTDDGPPIINALNAAKGQSGACAPVYIHNASTSGGQTINSYTDTTTTNCPNGTLLINSELNLADTLAITNLQIKGFGSVVSGMSFGQQANGPEILVANGAYPGIYITSNGTGTKFSNVRINSFGGNGTNGYLQVFDRGLFPTFDDVNWTHQTPGPLSLSLVIDNPSTGFSYKFDRNAFEGGYYSDVCGGCYYGMVPFPSMVMTGVGQPNAGSGLLNVSRSWFINKGGFAFEQTAAQGGSSFIFSDVSTESQAFPPISFSGPSLNQISNQLYIQNIFSADTAMSQVAVFGANLKNASYLSGSGPTNQRPWITGGLFIGLVQTGNIDVPQSVFAEEQISSSKVIDGVFNTVAAGPLSLKRFSEPVSLLPGVGIFTNQITPTAPTCSVSAGGSLGLATYTFFYAPVWWNNGEGFQSPQSTACTTTGGNQTITVNWTAIPGVKGYNLYRCIGTTCLAVKGSSPMYASSATSDVITAFGGSSPPPTIPASGPSAMLGASVGTQNLLLGAINSGGVLTENVPTLTANRTQTRPDAAGQVVLDSTLTGLSQFTTFITGFDYSTTQSLRSATYDNFNRANGGLGANWTTAYGTAFAIASNQVTATNSGQGAFWSATTFSADQFSEANVSPASGFAGPTVRMVAPGNGYICLEQFNSLGIFKLTTGNAGSALASSAPTTSAFDTVRLEVSGNSLTCRMNGPSGASIITASDATYSSGSPGFSTFVTGAAVDNWNGGNLNSIPRLNAEHDWLLSQHFVGPVTIGTTAPVAGALATNTLYVPNIVLNGSNALNAVSGNSGRVAQSSGAMTQTKLKTADANGNIVDTAGSGTLGITFPAKYFIPGALCNNVTPSPAWNLPTANAAAASCNTGTNVQESTLDFADGQSAQYGLLLPSDWTGAIDARLIFFDASTSGTVIYQIATACTPTNGSVADDTAFNTADSFATITLASPTKALWATTKTGLNITGCSAGNKLHIKVSRTTDTAAAVASMVGLELTIRRAL